jgi:hypothetical protein
MRRPVLILVLLIALAGLVRPAAAQPITPAPPARSPKAVYFAADGMRPDLVDRYVGQGAMPAYAGLIASGVKGQNGLTQAFPPNTGVGWHTLATGAWPGEHGSTNDNYHRIGEANFNNRTSFLADGLLQADTLQQSAERAGKSVVSVEWVGARNLAPPLQGPVVDSRSSFSTRGVLVNYNLPGQPAGANALGVAYQRVDLDPAVGWTNVPASFSAPKQEQLALANTAGLENLDRFYNLYIYDSTNDAKINYDRVLAVPSSAGKDGNAASARLSSGQWAEVKVALTGARAGQAAGFYLKLLAIAPDLSKFQLYFTAITRVNASYNALGLAGSAAFEETLARDLPTSIAADPAPLQAGVIDEGTFVEQGLKWNDAHFAYLNYIFGRLGLAPDLLMLGSPVADTFQHQFLGLLAPTDMDGDANPYYANVVGLPSAKATSARPTVQPIRRWRSGER